MSRDERKPESYARKIGESTRKYVEELLGENRALRAKVVTLQTETERLVVHLRRLEQELSQRSGEAARLRESLEHIELDNQQFSERYTEVERQSANLVNLYVASYRLHSTLDRAEVLEVIKEIIINQVGSEEMGVFELDPSGGELRLVASFGIDEERYRTVPIDSGTLGRVVRSGEMYLAEPVDLQDRSAGSEPRLSACVPLILEGNVTGVIAVFGLLPQKPAFEDIDRELFELLAVHSAQALYCTRLHGRVAAGGPG